MPIKEGGGRKVEQGRWNKEGGIRKVEEGWKDISEGS